MSDTLLVWPTKGNSEWDEDDPFDLFRQCRILRTNAWAIIRDQYGKHAALLEPYYAQTRLWRYARISKTELRKTNLVTGDSEIVGPTRNANGLHSHIDENLADLRRRGKTAIFGEPGREVVYDGGVPIDDARASAIWDAMESAGHSRIDHLDLQAGEWVPKKTLLVEIEPVTRAERETILELDEDRKRKQRIDWKNLPGMDAAKIAAVQDPDQSVDYRKVIPRAAKTVVVPRAVEAIQ